MMDDLQIKRKTICEGRFEDVVEINEHYFLVSKKHRVTVLPYSIDSRGLLDKVGVVKDYNYVFEDYDYTLINGYISQDDGTDLVAANRVLFEVIGTNVTNADDWMYLGSLYNNLTSDSAISLYCVDIGQVEIKETEEVKEKQEKKKFQMIDVSRASTSDDTLILASFFRLYNFFYINSLSNNKKE
jgi:hypothetical protein